ncbi:MAG: acyltransferase [Solirubrobacterales bacterium]|nr:acyltransferase [Solirubrobacterales bacterium]
MRSARRLLLIVLLSVAAAATSAGAAGDPTALPCFGAASRTPGVPCVNPVLRTLVVPTPARAQTVPDADCNVVFRSRTLFVCGWGAPQPTAVRTVALIGDSHAAHWRPALELVAARRTWRVVSMSRAGCPLTAATTRLPTPARSRSCRRWKRAVQRWLRAHPEVSVVLVAQHRVRVAVPEGHSQGPEIRRGYVRAWRQVLQPYRRHVVVLRDTPRDTPDTLRCVTAAIAGGYPAGPACAIPRSYALRPDPAVAAARALRGQRVQTLDLTRAFCSARLCLPVVGGALVHRDTQHMTREWVTSLGPLLDAALGRLMRSWRDPVRRTGDVTDVTASLAVDAQQGRVSPLRPASGVPATGR